jgi:hypothetical protein
LEDRCNPFHVLHDWVFDLHASLGCSHGKKLLGHFRATGWIYIMFFCFVKLSGAYVSHTRRQDNSTDLRVCLFGTAGPCRRIITAIWTCSPSSYLISTSTRRIISQIFLNASVYSCPIDRSWLARCTCEFRINHTHARW